VAVGIVGIDNNKLTDIDSSKLDLMQKLDGLVWRLVVILHYQVTCWNECAVKKRYKSFSNILIVVVVYVKYGEIQCDTLELFLRTWRRYCQICNVV